MTTAAKAIAYHDRIAVGWDDRYRTGSFGRRARLFRQTLLPMVAVTGHWLDAGCGTGYFSRVLVQSKAVCTGIDASFAMLQEARRIAANLDLGASLTFQRVATVEETPFRDDAFDGCIALSVIEYLSNPGTCLDELVRALRPGGHLIISVPHKWSPVRAVQRLLRHARGGRGTATEYLDTSSNTMWPTEICSALEWRGMRIMTVAGFDAVIPAPLHGLLPPSLIYVVAQKRESDPAPAFGARAEAERVDG